MAEEQPPAYQTVARDQSGPQASQTLPTPVANPSNQFIAPTQTPTIELEPVTIEKSRLANGPLYVNEPNEPAVPSVLAPTGTKKDTPKSSSRRKKIIITASVLIAIVLVAVIIVLALQLTGPKPTAMSPGDTGSPQTATNNALPGPLSISAGSKPTDGSNTPTTSVFNGTLPRSTQSASSTRLSTGYPTGNSSVGTSASSAGMHGLRGSDSWQPLVLLCVLSAVFVFSALFVM
ncbi:hypothetical protein BJ742DRAFT_530139 [Cladochytrium replicatum]|nr:hypothetical protein BJ742DRAFT_530139 [Cladochytrium replicatum]